MLQIKVLLFVVLSLTLSGCASLKSAWKFISVPPPYYEKTPEEQQDYEEGYEAGCEDGREDAENKEKYFSADPFYWLGKSSEYRSGYEKGYYEAYYYGND